MLRGAVGLALALGLASSGCGYRSATAYRVHGGLDRVHVCAFENDSTDPELGAVITAVLRDELARRGAVAGADAPVQLEGTVRVVSGTSASYFNAAATVTVEIRARLSVNGKQVHETTIKRTEPHPRGADALEAEGRRATALRKLAREAAREVLAAFEEERQK